MRFLTSAHLQFLFDGLLWTVGLSLLAFVGGGLLGFVVALLIRPCEVLSRVANVTILEVANNALRVLLQHRHVIIGSLA